MSDFIKPVPQEPADKGSHRRQWLLWGMIVLAALLIFSIILLTCTNVFDGLFRSVRYIGKRDSDYGKVTFDGYGVTDHALVDDSLVVAGHGGLTVYKEKGSVAGKLQRDISAPKLMGQKDALLVYDVGGTYLGVLDEGGIVSWEITTPGKILDADFGETGYVSVLFSGVDARSTLEVYNEDGNLIYRRNAKSHYLNACSISPNGRYVVATALGQEDLSFVTTAEIYPTGTEEVAAKIPLGSQIIYDLAFTDDETVCAIGQQAVRFFSVDGELLGEYEPESGEIAAYSFDGDDFVVLAEELFQTGKRYRVIAVENDGTIRGSLQTEETPLHISANQEYASVITAQNIYIYNDRMELQHKTENEEAYIRALVRKDGTVLLVGSGAAELYIP